MLDTNIFEEDRFQETEKVGKCRGVCETYFASDKYEEAYR